MDSTAQRLLFSGILIVCLFIIATTAKIIEMNPENIADKATAYPNMKLTSSGSNTAEDTKTDGAVNLNLDGDTPIEGDILLTKQQKELWKQPKALSDGSIKDERYKRQAYHDSKYPYSFWRNGIVPYSFQKNLSSHARKIISKSMDFWEQNTCINFKRTSYEKSVLVFMRGDGCYSYVGRVWSWKKQPLSVGYRCEHIHTISHEIGHALGFLHTHNRADRDQYISVNFQNVKDGLTSNFKRVPRSANDNYGLPYDYGSVMHYSKKAFTANDGSTIIPRVSWYEDTMGSGTGPTFIDLLMMNKHYNCLDRCPQKMNSKCQNGGYPHPRKCDQCLCPSGYGGKFCQRKADSPGCGGYMRATSKWQSLNAKIGDGQFKDDMSYCHWWIQAEPEQVIEAKITSLSGCCSEGCIFGGLELKVQPDKRLTGYRFCCRRSAGKTVEVKGPVLPVILFNRKDFTGMQIKFRVKTNETLESYRRKFFKRRF